MKGALARTKRRSNSAGGSTNATYRLATNGAAAEPSFISSSAPHCVYASYGLLWTPPASTSKVNDEKNTNTAATATTLVDSPRLLPSSSDDTPAMRKIGGTQEFDDKITAVVAVKS